MGSIIAGVIYMSDNCSSGIARRNFNMFHKICGESTWRNVVIVTNMLEDAPQDINETRERELHGDSFELALDRGARIVQHQNTVESAHNIIQMIVANRPVVFQIQRELVDQQKDIVDTTAGKIINRELKQQIRRHQAELWMLQEEMARTSRKDETRRKLEGEAKRLQEQMAEIARDLGGMSANYGVERDRMKVRVKEVEHEAKERQRAKAESGASSALLLLILLSTLTVLRYIRLSQLPHSSLSMFDRAHIRSGRTSFSN